MKLVLAGSRKIDPAPLRYRLQAFLGGAGNGPIEVHLRRGLWTAPGRFENVVCQIVATLPQDRFTVRWHVPEPSDDHPGRASVYLRDIEMVEGADVVLLFFDPGEAVDGYSGTAHLLDKAIMAGVPVEAFTVDEEGHVAWIGGYDGRG